MTPLALDPEATFELVLESDKDKPEGEQPTFICRYVNNRNWRQLAHVADNLEQIKQTTDGIEELLDTMEEALLLSLVDWRNMVDPQTGKEIPFAADNLGDVLTVAEISELIQKAVTQSQLRPAAKKNSGSPSPDSSGKSAGGVTADQENATADRRDQKQSSSSAPSAEDAETTNASTAGADDSRLTNARGNT